MSELVSTIFKEQIKTAGEEEHAEMLWKEIYVAYTSKGRQYHTLIHLDDIPRFFIQKRA